MASLNLSGALRELNKGAPFHPLPLGSTLTNWNPSSVSILSMGMAASFTIYSYLCSSSSNDLILWASSPKGLQKQIDALANFCDFQQLTANLVKTKVMSSMHWRVLFLIYISASNGKKLRSWNPIGDPICGALFQRMSNPPTLTWQGIRLPFPPKVMVLLNLVPNHLSKMHFWKWSAKT